MAVPGVDHEAHNPLECHGCAVVTLMQVRRDLQGLQKRLVDLDGPGDVDEHLRVILRRVPDYERTVSA